MMEDRHSLGEPRPSSFSQSPSSPSSRPPPAPSWQVDIYRNGVSQPVDVITIDETTLPPRTNKKGKVVWRLPENHDVLPSFGTDERRRILELFKERKKERKKKQKDKGKKPPAPQTQSASSPPVLQPEDGPCDTGGGGILENEAATANEPSASNGGSGRKPGGGGVRAAYIERRKKRDKQADRGAVRPSLRTFDEPEQGPTAAVIENDEPSLRPVNLPPGVMPPSKCIMDPSSYRSAAPDRPDAPANETPAEAAASMPSTTMPTATTLPTEPLPTDDKRYIVVPEHDRPPLPPQPSDPPPSLAVPAARCFVDLYYPYLAHGLGPDLALHYTSHAQKSVSVGGAHSVVTGRDEIVRQLLSLSGTQFAVRGVVAQDTADGRGVHILVTGVARTAAPGGGGAAGSGGALGIGAAGGGGSVTAFAHSVSLAPASEGDSVAGSLPPPPYSFLIHNDAMSLMGGDQFGFAPPAPPQPAISPVIVQQPQPQSHLPPPGLPPGLGSDPPTAPPGLFG